MAMYAVSDETLTGIANAIRSKTGSDDFMPVSAMASAIEGISGGGNISFANKVASGSFRFDEDTKGNKYFVHNLGEIPKLFLVYTNDFTDESLGGIGYFKQLVYASDDVNMQNDKKAFWGAYSSAGTGTQSHTTYGTSYGINPMYMDAQRVYINGNGSAYQFKGGATYHWIALA